MPEQWEKELNEFAAAVRKKKFDKISYDDWRMMWSWRDLPDTAEIYLKINSDSDFMCSPYGKMDFVIFEKKANCPFLDYLQSKYYAVLDCVESCTQWPITNLVQPHLIIDMPYTVNYAPSPYSAIATSDVISNSNFAKTITYDSNAVLAPGTYQTTTIDNKKEKKDMNFFKNFEFGPVKNDTVRLSPYGLAVKNLDNSWVSYDGKTDSIIDVDVFNFEGKNLIYKIPAAPHTVHAGDMIVHQGKGMYVVADVCEGDSCVSVIDPRAGESKEILFCKNMFGFNYVTKLVSILNGFDNFTDFSPSSDDPFGNMWMLALLSNENEDLSSSILPLMLMNQFNPSANTDKNNFNMNNPLMWILLSNKK